MSTHDQPPDLSCDPLAIRVVKRPVPVAVAFAMQDGLLQTWEGPVHYHAGDALMTGPKGEQWPISRAHFDVAYQPCAGTLAGAEGQYTKRPRVVWARKMDRAFAVEAGTARDALKGGAGDWLLQYGPGAYGIVAKGIFAETYQVVDT